MSYPAGILKGIKMRNTALVTGASSGIGKAISDMLLGQGYTVYGIGRNFEAEGERERFHPIVFDLLKQNELPKLIKDIKKELRRKAGEEEVKFSLLVNCAGVGYYGPHEQLSVSNIAEMTAVNLSVPMILTRLLLRDLKENQGTIVNISSVTANQTNNTHGCAYGATKAGLTSFSRSLFEEVRKYGVRVAVIHPDLTDTNLYRNADFTCASDEDCHILAEEVADAVRYILEARDGLVIPEITLKPQRNRIVRKS